MLHTGWKQWTLWTGWNEISPFCGLDGLESTVWKGWKVFPLIRSQPLHDELIDTRTIGEILPLPLDQVLVGVQWPMAFRRGIPPLMIATIMEITYFQIS